MLVLVLLLLVFGGGVVLLLLLKLLQVVLFSAVLAESTGYIYKQKQELEMDFGFTYGS